MVDGSIQVPFLPLPLTNPLSSASFTIAVPIRSFTEQAGFRYSNFAATRYTYNCTVYHTLLQYSQNISVIPSVSILCRPIPFLLDLFNSSLFELVPSFLLVKTHKLFNFLITSSPLFALSITRLIMEGWGQPSQSPPPLSFPCYVLLPSVLPRMDKQWTGGKEGEWTMERGETRDGNEVSTGRHTINLHN